MSISFSALAARTITDGSLARSYSRSSRRLPNARRCLQPRALCNGTFRGLQSQSLMRRSLTTVSSRMSVSIWSRHRSSLSKISQRTPAKREWRLWKTATPKTRASSLLCSWQSSTQTVDVLRLPYSGSVSATMCYGTTQQFHGEDCRSGSSLVLLFSATSNVDYARPRPAPVVRVWSTSSSFACCCRACLTM